MSKFKTMRKPRCPTKPERSDLIGEQYNNESLYDKEISLSELKSMIKSATQKDVSDDNIKIHLEAGWEGDFFNLLIYSERTEEEYSNALEEYNIKYEIYEKKIKKYNDWLEKNKEKIEKEKQRKISEKEKEMREIQNKFEEKMKQIQKEIENIK